MLILPAILDVQSSSLLINMCNGFFHIKKFFLFKFNQYIYLILDLKSNKQGYKVERKHDP